MKKLSTTLYVLLIVLMVILFLGAGCYPMETGTVEIEDSANAIAYNATTKKVFIADTISGIKAIDVSDPEDPIQIADYEEADRSLKIASSGDLCFVGDFLEGIRVIDFSDIYAIESHLITDSILPNTLNVKNGYLYVGDLKDGFKSYRIEQNNPWLVKEDTCDDTTGVMTAVISPDGNRAYVVDTQNGLMVLDISDPGNMTQIGTALTTLKVANAMAIKNNYLYIATSENIKIIDILEMNNLKEIEQFGYPTYALYIYGNDLYTASGDNGLNKYDITDNTRPIKRFMKKFGTSKPVMDVVVSGNYAYLACEKGGFIVCKLSD